MIELHEKTDIARRREEAFAYIQDFTTAAEWDPTTRDARKLTPGPVAQGSQFELVCELPVGHITVHYTVTHLEQDNVLELQGRSTLFDVTDIIHFTDTATGCHIDYRACFEFKGPVKILEPAMRNSMTALGRRTIEGVHSALIDQFPEPQARLSTQRADNWLVPGLALFSRVGYTRGRKQWQPVSACMSDKHVVVTGASSGLGFAAATELARAGASLTLVIRDETKAEGLVNSIRRETGCESIHIELADLSLMEEVNQLLERLLQRGKGIDVLINNAGALFNQWGETVDGLEQSFALLALSPYRLTTGLKPLLVKSRQPRVINVVSGGMFSQRLELGKLQAGPDDYSGTVAYARAKRALMVLTEQWAKDWAEHGIVVNAMHPGWADTPGVASALPGFRKLTRRILRSPQQGADTIVWLARATEAGKSTGKLFLDREPRATHLLSSTVEQNSQRDALQAYLDQAYLEAEATSTWQQPSVDNGNERSLA